MNIPKFKITHKAEGYTRIVSAFNSKSAWGKFVTQFFGALKPSRKEYTINRIK